MGGLSIHGSHEHQIRVGNWQKNVGWRRVVCLNHTTLGILMIHLLFGREFVQDVANSVTGDR